MIGTTAALIGMAVASGASKAAGSAISAHKAGNAAKAQQEASNKAADLYKQVYGDFQQQNEPYLNAGRNSMNLLGDLMTPQGVGSRYQPGASGPPQMMTGAPRPPMPMGPGGPGMNVGNAMMPGGGGGMVPPGPPRPMGPGGGPGGPQMMMGPGGQPMPPRRGPSPWDMPGPQAY